MSQIVKKEHISGSRVLEKKTILRFSQAELAKKIGASKGAKQNNEAGALPKGEYAISLAMIFDCSIDWLLTGKSHTGNNDPAGSEKGKKSVSEPAYLERESTPEGIKQDKNGIHIPSERTQILKHTITSPWPMPASTPVAAPSSCQKEQPENTTPSGEISSRPYPPASKTLSY